MILFQIKLKNNNIFLLLIFILFLPKKCTSYDKSQSLNASPSSIYSSSISFTLSPPHEWIPGSLILGNVMIASYHKTGTVFAKNMFEYLHNSYPKFKFSMVEHFNEVEISDLKPEVKCVVFIRHPMEIIASATRYHLISHEKWLHQPKEAFGNKTYSQVINELETTDERLLFEMRNHAYKTIWSMYKDRKTKRDFCLWVKLEEFYDKSNFQNISSKISKKIEVPFEELFKIVSMMGSFKRNPTTNSLEYTFTSLFKKIHYFEFSKLFPNDIFEVMEYEKPSSFEESTSSII